MGTAPKMKTTSKRRLPSKARSRKTTKPLLATSPATVRKDKPSARKAQAPPLFPPIPDPVFDMLEFMARIASVYAELPSRLVQCHSPVEFWQEQARFAQRIVDECRLLGPAARRKQTRTRSAHP